MRRVSTLLALASAALAVAGPAHAVDESQLPFPGAPPNQPYTYGDCVGAVTLGLLEDHTSGVRSFTQSVKPLNSRAPGDYENFGCKGYGPPGDT